MKLSNIKWAFLLAVTLGVTACDDDDDYDVTIADAPVLVSTSPTSGATDVEAGDVTITITYDKNVFFATDNTDQITLSNGTIESADVIGSSATLTIVANCPDKGTTYTLNIPEGVVTGPSSKPAPAVTLSFTTAGEAVSTTISTEPANANMSATTRAVFDYLHEIYGTSTLSGMMANVNWNTECSEQVYQWTGKYPAINGYDYIHLPYSGSNWIDYSDISPVQDWWDAGGLVTASWHWNVPTSETYSYTVWEGENAMGSWSSYIQLTDEASLAIFANAKEGDVITVTVKDLESYPQGSFKNNSWTQIAEGTEYFDITGDFSLTITSDILASLQSGGLIVSGQNYTATGVYLTGGGSGEYAFYMDDTDFDADNALVEGTWENDVFVSDLATIATYLKLLADADIPVLWRPFHEASGGWFWWGKNATSLVAMWQYMFDYFQAQGLNNLIWVWTSETGDNAWYPGDNYVDIVGCDIYGSNAASCASDYTTLTSTYGKMVTLSECGYSEYTSSCIGYISEQWSAGAYWLWFMPWYDNEGATTSHADQTWWQDAMNQSFVLSRDDLPSFK